MRLYYYKVEGGNFGDDINEWIWERLVPGYWHEADETYFCGIGTLISSRLPAAKRWIIFSSGVGYNPLPSDFHSHKWIVACVRGPLSAHVLKLDKNKVVADGAILIGTFPEYAPMDSSSRSGVLFMPHHGAVETGAWQEVCLRADITYVSPGQDSRETISQIRKARLVIADAMHAAIVADCLRTPWIPVATSRESNTFKWLDWSMALGVAYKPVRLPPSTLMDSVRSNSLWLYGHDFYAKTAMPDDAIRRFEKYNFNSTRASKYFSRRQGYRIYHHIRKSVLRAPSLVQTAIDERLINTAANALRRISKTTGFLSDDQMLSSKQDALLTRLRDVTERMV